MTRAAGGERLRRRAGHRLRGKDRTLFDLAAWLLAARIAAPDAPAPAAVPDSLPPRRVVRQFAPVEVSGPRAVDAGAIHSVRTLTSEQLRSLPVDRFADAVALRAGVVAESGELHVRGGRTGELAVTVLGVPLADPQSGAALELPLFAVRGADLLTGPVDADRAGSLAGDLDVQTEVPAAAPAARLRWVSDGRRSRGFDAVHAGAAAPLGRGGLGVAAAFEARLDDAGLPALRSEGRSSGALGSFGWRQDNHVLGWIKLAPLERPQRASLEVLANRVVRAPFDPMFSYDGWVTFHELTPGGPSTPFIELTDAPVDSSSFRYRAADHRAMTEERRWAAIASFSTLGAHPVRATAGWVRSRSLTSPGLRRDTGWLTSADRVVFGPYNVPPADPFHAISGDEPYYRDAAADRWLARADAVFAPDPGHRLRVGAGATRDEVRLLEIDDPSLPPAGVDPLRRYHATAPAAFAYLQHRWEYSGLVINDGLRFQWFDPGRAASGGRPEVSFSPRLGLAYPVSTRDVFSFGYARIRQEPARDLLYDSRDMGYDRRPVGTGAVGPADVITWQAAIRHLFDPAWSFQLGTFWRDVWGEPGVRNAPAANGRFRLVYESADEAHAGGWELELTRALAGRGHVTLAYTFMEAAGSQSSPDGIAYGSTAGPRPLPTGSHALDWDLRHVLALESLVRRGTWTCAWATRAASGRPWTPLDRDGSQVNDFPPLYEDQSRINTRRLPWNEETGVDVRWTPRRLRGAVLLLSVTNLFDERGDRLVTLGGYPNPTVNTLYDEYDAYRTETGNGGGAYWNGDGAGHLAWIPVHDPRLARRRRSIRLGFELGL